MGQLQDRRREFAASRSHQRHMVTPIDAMLAFLGTTTSNDRTTRGRTPASPDASKVRSTLNNGARRHLDRGLH